MARDLVFIALGLILGSLPSGVIAARTLAGVDIRRAGSGNIGAANVARTAGMKAGILVAVIDILKGVVPVLLGLWAGVDQSSLALIALAAVFGHDFSIFLSFKGGKGVATTLGVALVLAPLATVVALLLWIAIFAIFRYSSVASLVSLLVLPLGALLTSSPPVYALALLALFLLAAGKHWENILRLAQGRENKFMPRPARGS